MRGLRCLIACEMTGRVRDAFAARGWEAWSADLLPSEIPAFSEVTAEGFKIDKQARGGHYQGDCRDLFRWDHPVNAERMDYANTFPVSCDLDGTGAPLWDLVIAFPPCTDLSLAGARYWRQKQADGRQAAAAAFFMQMVNAPARFVAVENPVGIMGRKRDPLYRVPDQVVQPWMFGDPLAKATCLWLVNADDPGYRVRGTDNALPLLVPDNVVEPTGRVATGGGSYRTDKRATGRANNEHEDSEGRKMRHIVRSRTPRGLARAMAQQWGTYIEEKEKAA